MMKTKNVYENMSQKLRKLGKQEVMANGFAFFVIKKGNECILQLELIYLIFWGKGSMLILK